jgi:hypothetical protein
MVARATNSASRLHGDVHYLKAYIPMQGTKAAVTLAPAPPFRTFAPATERWIAAYPSRGIVSEIHIMSSAAPRHCICVIRVDWRDWPPVLHDAHLM